MARDSKPVRASMEDYKFIENLARVRSINLRDALHFIMEDYLRLRQEADAQPEVKEPEEASEEASEAHEEGEGPPHEGPVKRPKPAQGAPKIVFDSPEEILDYVRKQGLIRQSEGIDNLAEVLRESLVEMEMETSAKRILGNPIILMYWAYSKAKGYKGDLDSFLTWVTRKYFEETVECPECGAVIGRGISLAFVFG